ncbi:LegC family aminotransferase [Wukongibacter baidiensis]|uniref:LegC family aminotransferase n=1 Tax=Wukongibacter baidiensis TaxID=1723361 RepID=UPI003D7F38C4
MDKIIPLSVPNLKGNELEYLTHAIETEWVSTGGKYIDDFEKEISKYLGVEKAVACQSGTAGLHLALKLCNVSSGDEVIVPTLTFIAAVNPVKYLGAEPIFMDCDDTLTMDMDKLEEFLENECIISNGKLVNRKTKKHIKAVVVVHVFGNMANMEKLVYLSKKFNFKIVEDATEALGTYYNEGIYVGKFAGTIGDFGVYSFNGNKIITTGGGGMLVAKNIEDTNKARYFSTQAKDDTLYYIHEEVGYNYRMTNIQAALGLAQQEQLEKFIEVKKKNYYLYKSIISDIKGLEILDFKENIRPNYWFYSLLIKKDKFGSDRDEILKGLGENNIQSRPIWGLIHEQTPYINNQSYKIEKAKYYFNRVLNIPCSSNLTYEDVLTVTTRLKDLKK